MSQKPAPYIQTHPLDPKAWTAGWVPLSYKTTKQQRKHSVELRWSRSVSGNHELYAICRGYYRKERVVIGDVWMAEDLRGQMQPSGEKTSARVFGAMFAKLHNHFQKRMEFHVDPTDARAVAFYNKQSVYPTTTTHTHYQVWVYHKGSKVNNTTR
jgi:hypothetical protein